jgi:prolyl-tRNA editing enzyme YbaK/EbsC (Cys-tRNA(Pro) deacylase)
MPNTLGPSAQKVQDALKPLGFSNQLMELQPTTHTAAEAVQAVGCQVEQIAKSIVFQGKQTDKLILVIDSGSNRINGKKSKGIYF